MMKEKLLGLIGRQEEDFQQAVDDMFSSIIDATGRLGYEVVSAVIGACAADFSDVSEDPEYNQRVMTMIVRAMNIGYTLGVEDASLPRRTIGTVH